MRTLFFRTMALVLGLFTVTAVFASTLKNTGFKLDPDMHYFNDTAFDPQTDWQTEAAWGDPVETGPACPEPEELETICRVRLEEGQDISDFLDDVSNLNYQQLLQHPQIDVKNLE